MKTCRYCATQLDDNAIFCYTCGAKAEDAAPVYRQQPVYQQQPAYQQQPVYQQQPAFDLDSYAPSSSNPAPINNGNIPLGILGAILFSLAGVLAYCLLYQVGIIAGVAGVVIYLLAYKGYGVLSGAKKAYSPVGIAVSAVTMLVMIFVSEMLSVRITAMVALIEEGMSFDAASSMVSEVISHPDSQSAITEDLSFAYIFGIISVVANIINVRRERKNA